MLLKDQQGPRIPKSYLQHGIVAAHPEPTQLSFPQKVRRELSHVKEGYAMLTEDVRREWAKISNEAKAMMAFAAIVFVVGGIAVTMSISRPAEAGQIDEANKAMPVPGLTTRTPTPEPTSTPTPPEAPEFLIGQEIMGEKVLELDLKKSKAGLGYPIGLVKTLPPYYVMPEVTMYVQHLGRVKTFKNVPIHRSGGYNKGLPSYARFYLPPEAVEIMGIKAGESTFIGIVADLNGEQADYSLTIEWNPEDMPPKPKRIGGVQE